MADADIARKAHHVPMSEYIADKAIAFALMQPFFVPGHDPGRILTAMLHDGQCVVHLLVNGLLANDSNNAAHVSLRVSIPARGLQFHCRFERY